VAQRGYFPKIAQLENGPDMVIYPHPNGVKYNAGELNLTAADLLAPLQKQIEVEEITPNS